MDTDGHVPDLGTAPFQVQLAAFLITKGKHILVLFNLYSLKMQNDITKHQYLNSE